MTFKPLLASPAEIDKLSYPLIASPKIDGIRCLIHPDLGPVTRTLKPIPNAAVRAVLAEALPCLDGELVTYTHGKVDDFNTVQSKIMSEDGEPEFVYHAFDSFRDPQRPYTERFQEVVEDMVSDPLHVIPLIMQYLFSKDDLMKAEKQFVKEGYEGIMVRRPSGIYKFGRSTVNEEILLKIKRFQDDEAVIVGVIEKMHNANEATTNSLGHTERSTSKAGMVPANTLGALTVDWKGKQFEIGTGFDDATRDALWSLRDALIGRSVTFKYQGVGSKGAPRFPVFLGIRRDLVA